MQLRVFGDCLYLIILREESYYGDEITVTVVSAPEVEGCVYEPMSQTFVVDGLTRLITVSHSETTVAFNDYGYRTLQISVPEV